MRVCAVAEASEGEVTAQLASTLTAEDCRELLLFVMESSQRIALEPRPEVRSQRFWCYIEQVMFFGCNFWGGQDIDKIPHLSDCLVNHMSVM